MSTSFPNMPSDSSLPVIGMSDPNGTLAPNQSAGGATKVVTSDKSGPAFENGGYGFMTNDASMKIQGEAPGGENSSGIPAAQPIEPMTFGNPSNSGNVFREGQSPKYGFTGEVPGSVSDYSKYR